MLFLLKKKQRKKKIIFFPHFSHLSMHDCTAFLRQFMFIVAQRWPVVVSVAYLHIWTVEPKQTEMEIFLTWSILWLNKGKKKYISFLNHFSTRCWLVQRRSHSTTLTHVLSFEEGNCLRYQHFLFDLHALVLMLARSNKTERKTHNSVSLFSCV